MGRDPTIFEAESLNLNFPAKNPYDADDRERRELNQISDKIQNNGH